MRLPWRDCWPGRATGSRCISSIRIHDGVELAEKRGSVLWNIDKAAPSRFSHENPDVRELYRDYLKKPLSDVSHHLLHTDHQAWKMPSQK